MASTPNPRLRAAREHLGLTREQAAERIAVQIHAATGRESSFDANHLGKLERGVVAMPSPVTRAAVCAAYDAEEIDLWPTSDDTVARVTAALTGTCDAATLEAVAGVLASLRRLEDATSAAEVLPAVQQQTALVEHLATNAPAKIRPAAVGLLSEFEQYQGWLSIPMNQWGQARRRLDRAAVLALEAGDPLRLSTALSFQAYRSLRRDELSSADALNEAACRDDRVHHGLRTYITYQRAEVLARDGATAGAVRLLNDADVMVQTLPDADELPDSGYWYVPAFFLGQRAFVLRALGDKHGARQAAADALAEMPQGWREAEWAQRRRELAAIT